VNCGIPETTQGELTCPDFRPRFRLRHVFLVRNKQGSESVLGGGVCHLCVVPRACVYTKAPPPKPLACALLLTPQRSKFKYEWPETKVCLLQLGFGCHSDKHQHQLFVFAMDSDLGTGLASGIQKRFRVISCCAFFCFTLLPLLVRRSGQLFQITQQPAQWCFLCAPNSQTVVYDTQNRSPGFLIIID